MVEVGKAVVGKEAAAMAAVRVAEMEVAMAVEATGAVERAAVAMVVAEMAAAGGRRRRRWRRRGGGGDGGGGDGEVKAAEEMEVVARRWR